MNTPTEVPHRPAEGTVRITPIAALPNVLRQFAVAPAPILEKYGLTEQSFLDQDATILFEKLGQLLQDCAEQTGCPHFGLLIGQQGNASSLGAIGFLLKNAPDVSTALSQLVLNLDMNDRGAAPYLDILGETAMLRYEILRPDIPGEAQINDGSLAIVWNIMRSLCGPEWQPIEVHFRHDIPSNPDAYQQFFNAPLRFNALHNAIVFRSDWLKQKIVLADPLLHQHFLKHIERVRRNERGDFREQAYRALLLLIGAKPCTLGDLAKQLSLQPRTLNRRLQEEQTSFRELYQQARHETARQLLIDTRIPVDQVAAMLGFSDSTAFSRAFTQWEGLAPGKWRKHPSQRFPITRLERGSCR